MMLFGLLRRGLLHLGLPLSWRWWLLAACLTGVLLVAHGCHGPDEDHEL
jgi:hypothetical protein